MMVYDAMAPFLSIFHRKYVEQSILTFLKNLKEMIGRTRRQPLISIFIMDLHRQAKKKTRSIEIFKKRLGSI